MNRIAGNNYDEGNREDELGFDPYRDGLPQQLEDEFLRKKIEDVISKSEEIDHVTSEEGSRIYMFALLLESFKKTYSTDEVLDYLDKIHSRLIIHRDYHHYTPRETAVAFLNVKTNGAFGLIDVNAQCEPDNKIYKVNDLYKEYKQFLKDHNEYFHQGVHYIYKLSDFKTLIKQNTIVKNRGQQYKNKRIRSDVAIGLPKKRY